MDLAAIAAADMVIKRNDQRPHIRGALKVNAEPVDLTTALSLHLYLVTKETEEGKLRRVATGPLSVCDAASGTFEYSFEADDLIKAGLYDGEIEVIWDNGEPQTFPNGKDGKPYFTIGVLEDLGPIAPEE